MIVVAERHARNLQHAVVNCFLISSRGFRALKCFCNGSSIYMFDKCVLGQRVDGY